MSKENIFTLTASSMMVMIGPNSRARKEGKEREDVKGEYGGISGEEEENADYGYNPVSNM